MNMGRYRLHVVIILGAALVTGLILRATGLDFGLPVRARPDESLILWSAFSMGRGDLNPHMFTYPSLLVYAIFLCFVVYAVIGLMLGWYPSLDYFGLQYYLDPSPLYLIARGLVVCCGVATIYVTYVIAGRLYGKRVGLIAAWLIAVTYLHVRDSHFGVTDVPMTLMCTLSILYILRLCDLGRTRDYVYAGITAGLAASTKYNAALLAFSICVAHLMRAPTAADVVARLKGYEFKKLALAGIMSILAFIAISPFIILDTETFFSHFSYIVSFFQDDPNRGLDGLDRGWFYHLTISLRYGAGIPLLGCSLVGIFLALRHHTRRYAPVLLSFPLIYYVLTGMSKALLVRYMIPVLPVLCIMAALTIDTLVNAFLARIGERRFTPVMRPVLTCIATALVLAHSMNHAYHYNRLLQQTDTRLLAAEWMYTHAADGASVGLINKYTLRLRPTPRSVLQALEEFRTGDISGRVTSLYAQSLQSPGYEIFEKRPTEPWEHEFSLQNLPEYMVVHGYPPLLDQGFPKEISQILKQYRLVSSFAPHDPAQASPMFPDRLDVFFVPYTRFQQVERPGPFIYIYARNI